MRTTRGYKSNDVDDRRSQQASGGGFGGGGLGGGGANLLVGLFRRFGIPGVVVGAAFLYFTGGLGSGSGGGGAPRSADPASLAAEQPLVEFVSFVFDDAQKTWTEALAQNSGYKPSRLVLFRDRTQSACGLGEAAMGPFYCPGDQQVYIDLGFYAELKQRLGAPGDFAQAYVIAHEVGHHVQNLLGENRRVHGASRSEQNGENGLLVRLELQADCYAGMWANSAQRRELLEVGDLDEALNAATKIGDDALQQQATGVVRPESFTHGTSAQRKRWFKRGFDSGQVSECDTFKASAL